MKKILLLPVLAALLVCSAPMAKDFERVYGTGPSLTAPDAMFRFQELKHALKMPSLELTTIDGKQFSLESQKGKVVILNVWASWCGPCLQEVPAIMRLQKALKGSDVELIAVSVDNANVDLKKFIDRRGFSDLFTVQDKKLSIPNKMSVSVIPSNFVLDGEGNLVAYIEGYLNWDDPKVIPFLKELGTKYAHPVIIPPEEQKKL